MTDTQNLLCVFFIVPYYASLLFKKQQLTNLRTNINKCKDLDIICLFDNRLSFQ